MSKNKLIAGRITSCLSDAALNNLILTSTKFDLVLDAVLSADEPAPDPESEDEWDEVFDGINARI